MKLIDIILIICIIILVALAIFILVRNKKRGRGCCGNCRGCLEGPKKNCPNGKSV